MKTTQFRADVTCDRRNALKTIISVGHPSGNRNSCTASSSCTAHCFRIVGNFIYRQKNICIKRTRIAHSAMFHIHALALPHQTRLEMHLVKCHAQNFNLCLFFRKFFHNVLLVLQFIPCPYSSVPAVFDASIITQEKSPCAWERSLDHDWIHSEQFLH